MVSLLPSLIGGGELGDKNTKAPLLIVLYDFFDCNGGEKGIRTLDTVARIHAFQACAFNHSATSPARLQYNGKDSEFKRKLHFIQEKVTHSSLSAEILATDSRRVS